MAGWPARILGNGRDVVGETQRRVGAGMTEGSLASHAGVRCTEQGLYGCQLLAGWDFLAQRAVVYRVALLGASYHASYHAFFTCHFNLV